MPLPSFEDTIVAIATPAGTGALHVVRLSGPGAFAAADAVFRGARPLADEPSHVVRHGRLVDAAGFVVDDVLALTFRAPRSYTGEDTVEFTCHGNPLVAAAVVAALAAVPGVRAAGPGEFTLRAWEHGRLDLAQAEAVGELIQAAGTAAVRGARGRLDGLLSARLAAVRASLLEALSLVELELDFADEDVPLASPAQLAAAIDAATTAVQELRGTYRYGRTARDGVDVAIVGRPNAGKSSLLNCLLQENRAIVHHAPGTTRDVLREELSYRGLLFRLHDTAGLRATEDPVEREGVARTLAALTTADLVLLLDDGTADTGAQPAIEALDASRLLRVRTKIDLAPVPAATGHDAAVSNTTGEGIETLLELCFARAAGTAAYSEQPVVVASDRQARCLDEAAAALAACAAEQAAGAGGELLAASLRRALEALAELVGETVPDDVLERIFSRFCVGK